MDKRYVNPPECRPAVSNGGPEEAPPPAAPRRPPPAQRNEGDTLDLLARDIRAGAPGIKRTLDDFTWALKVSPHNIALHIHERADYLMAHVRRFLRVSIA
ncbi:hypothetical protein EVAR_48466_1 [Eumeta japonica]|uniref:Uncharacterized protein n=1 Tax=Eumeta variegata TaxID=151549 RepID=A0A4C1XGI4_EUMVA|nr:hypothetical protein EVAR_48466_1 [Eumeta japonica]